MSLVGQLRVTFFKKCVHQYAMVNSFGMRNIWMEVSTITQTFTVAPSKWDACHQNRHLWTDLVIAKIIKTDH